MAKQPETVFKRKILKDLKALKVYTKIYFFVKQAGSIRGLPDLIICMKGFFIAIEVKMNLVKARTTPRFKLQKWNIDEIRKAKGWGFIVDPRTWPKVYQKLIELASQGEIHDYVDFSENPDEQLRPFLRDLEPSKRPRRDGRLSGWEDGEED